MEKPTKEFIEGMIKYFETPVPEYTSQFGICLYLHKEDKEEYMEFFEEEMYEQTRGQFYLEENGYWFPVSDQTERIEFLKKCIENLNK